MGLSFTAARLVSALGKQLEAAGFAVDSDRLGAAFAKLDVLPGAESQILDTLKNFLGSVMSLSQQQIEPVLKQAEQNLGVHLKQLGLEPTINGDAKAPATNGVGQSHPTYITNVPEYKARLAVSAGPRPFTDLSEFHDFDAKL